MRTRGSIVVATEKASLVSAVELEVLDPRGDDQVAHGLRRE
jgi:hypothetical protein